MKGVLARKLLTFVGHPHANAKRIIHRGERHKAKRELRDWEEGNEGSVRVPHAPVGVAPTVQKGNPC
jgi:hypothetical protein